MLEPAQFFKCLSEELRLNTVLLIFSEGELCVCELMAALDVTQPKISRHLALLRSNGLLNDTRRGQWVYYSIAKNLPQWSTSILDTLYKSSSTPINQFKQQLKTMKNRPSCC
ncbi:MAG: metalloregulator ArsR/SmtB family transcription factor [Saccharospirillaceae bacterium]|nr:metalloregulator ArsR/SmtB family transcription factor [Pseudomonadales bacterium]NRB80644.1 metalloregulator ArsR/SmtB family transcription factor [Saccharospirillaceae bacterium]